jgi:hypothetical protein
VNAKPGIPPLIMNPNPNPKSGLFELSKYADVWFDRQTAQQEWEVFMRQHSPTDSDFTIEKEKLLQDHAKRFFKGSISYRTL